MTAAVGASPVGGVPPRYLLESPVRSIARAIVHRRWDIHVDAADFPADGPVIVAANHIGLIDGPLLAILGPRPVHALTKSEMFHGAAGAFLRHSGQIRLDRFHADRAAIRQSIATLEAGLAVGIFPEGTRGAGSFERIQRGTAYLAMVTGAPIVPAVFLGTRDPGAASGWIPPSGRRIDLVFGEPLRLDRVNWPRTRDNVGAATSRVRSHLVAHLAATLTATGRNLPGPLPSPEDH